MVVHEERARSDQHRRAVVLRREEVGSRQDCMVGIPLVDIHRSGRALLVERNHSLVEVGKCWSMDSSRYVVAGSRQRLHPLEVESMNALGSVLESKARLPRHALVSR